MLIYAFSNGNKHYTEMWSNQISPIKDFSSFLKNFNTAFMIFFYFFCGFETFSSVAKNVHNPEKNIKKAILYVLLISTLIYFFETFIFIGAEGIVSKDNYNVLNTIAFRAMSVFGLFLLFVQGFALKINGSAQYSLYAGNNLGVLSEEGYISDKLQVLGRDNLPIRASFIYLLNTFIFAFILIIFPYFIKLSIREFTEILGFVSLFYLLIYFAVLISIFKMI
jgi:amino acid transporter